MKKLCVLFLLTAPFIISCSKFDDGPWISFRSEEKRWEGEWLLKYLTVDGQDSLQYWNNFFGNECDFKFYPCETHDPYECNFEIHWGIVDSVFYNVSGHHNNLSDNYFAEIVFVEDPNSTSFPLWFMRYPKPRNSFVEWTVTRLKYKEMWLEMDVNNKHYELHLENINKF